MKLSTNHPDAPAASQRARQAIAVCPIAPKGVFLADYSGCRLPCARHAPMTTLRKTHFGFTFANLYR